MNNMKPSKQNLIIGLLYAIWGSTFEQELWKVGLTLIGAGYLLVSLIQLVKESKGQE